MIGEGVNFQCDGQYCSPLGAAAALGNLKIVQIPLDQGADPYLEGPIRRSLEYFFGSRSKHE